MKKEERHSRCTIARQAALSSFVIRLKSGLATLRSADFQSVVSPSCTRSGKSEHCAHHLKSTFSRIQFCHTAECNSALQGTVPRCSLSSFLIRHSSLILVTCLFPGCLFGATNDAELKLLPPHELLPPTYWEQHGTLIVLGIIAAVLLLGAGIGFLCRPKPPVPVPKIDIARHALSALRGRSEDGIVLSAASGIVRRYVTDVFQLAPGELNTTEFCRLIERHAAIGPELAVSLSEYLRASDRQKFAPPGQPSVVGCVARAGELIEAAHARDLLRRQSTAPEPPPIPARA